MKKRTLEGDEHLLHDDGARAVDRAAALGRLVYDERFDLEPSIAALLAHEDGLLRGEAILALTGRWRIAAHTPAAIRLLTADPDWVARISALHALSMYLRLGEVPPSDRRSILALLHRAAETDLDAGVRDAARNALAQIEQDIKASEE
jgi:hypothetical protein